MGTAKWFNLFLLAYLICVSSPGANAKPILSLLTSKLGQWLGISSKSAESDSQGREEPDDILDPERVSFNLYTRANPDDPRRVYVNDTKGLMAAGYNQKLNTKFIVHGFLNNLESDAIQLIKDSFLNDTNMNLNIIAVDWSSYAKVYIKVYERMFSLGGIIADFIDFLANMGIRLNTIHCIGHSLGAHACGLAGERTRGRIGRISGLDPARPGFDHDDAAKRLNPTQALFVDCIHTNAGLLGIETPICSADFFVNGGTSQPGCEIRDILFAGACSHSRAIEYFAESILLGHEFKARTCPSKDSGPEVCRDDGALMGYPATSKYKGIFQVKTNSESPYALTRSYTLSYSKP